MLQKKCGLVKKKAIPKWYNLSSDPRSIYIEIINEKYKIMQQKSTKPLYILVLVCYNIYVRRIRDMAKNKKAKSNTAVAKLLLEIAKLLLEIVILIITFIKSLGE